MNASQAQRLLDNLGEPFPLIERLAEAVIRLEAERDALAARVVGRVVLRPARIGGGKERGVVVDTHPERGWLVWWSHARVAAWTSPDALSTP
jgi:hypothetical protein